MTIVLALKVGDGVVLGADSASTLIENNGSYHNSYFNAEKLFNLVKGLPIGAVTHGLGGLAGRSVGSLAKDLRERMSDASNAEWYLDPDKYTIAEAAECLGVSVATIRRRIRDCHLPAAKHGRVVRICRRDIEAFFRASRRWQ